MCLVWFGWILHAWSLLRLVWFAEGGHWVFMYAVADLLPSSSINPVSLQSYLNTHINTKPLPGSRLRPLHASLRVFCLCQSCIFMLWMFFFPWDIWWPVQGVWKMEISFFYTLSAQHNRRRAKYHHAFEIFRVERLAYTAANDHASMLFIYSTSFWKWRKSP